MFFLLLSILFFYVCQCSDNCTKIDNYCQCDSKCQNYGDCCPGYEYISRTSFWGPILKCHAFSEYKSLLIIDKCAQPRHELDDLCKMERTIENNRLKSLIAVISAEGDIYRNIYCAQCNNKQVTKYIDADVKCPGLKLSSFRLVKRLINEDYDCNVTSHVPSQGRLCSTNFVRKCPTNYKLNYTILNYCENTIFETIEYPMKSGTTLYRNQYCCKCWNDTNCRIWREKVQTSYHDGFTFFLNYNEWETDVSNHSNSSSTDNAGHVVHYISFLFTLLSIFSVMVLIGIYAWNSVFHNFGGYLTLCLCTYLLAMNVTILLSTSQIVTTAYCKIIGITLHFFALGNFMWMAIYAFDLMSTFVFRSGSRHNSKSLRTFLLYFITGFGTSATLVAAASITEFGLNQDSVLRPNYGGKHCWFTSKFGGIIWYFVPVCVLLTWNTVSCILVSIKLYKTANECNAVRQRTSKSALLMCARLTAVCGLCYTLQIASVLTDVRVLIVCWSLLNCLQGCMLAACFLCTQKVHGVVTSTLSSIAGSRKKNSDHTVNTKNIIKARLPDSVD